MHTHSEIILPQCDDVESAIADIMAPFDERDDENRHAFWDSYVLGGRWSGAKMQARIGSERLDKFHSLLSDRKVTVSSITAGKQTLSPESQVPMVAALWEEHFPGVGPCPLFSNFSDQYATNGTLADDICTVSALPDGLTCSRIIIAGPSRDGDTFEAMFMCREDAWNGVNWEDCAWDGTVADGLRRYAKHAEGWNETYREQRTIQDDWLAVTVDSHS